MKIFVALYKNISNFSYSFCGHICGPDELTQCLLKNLHTIGYFKKETEPKFFKYICKTPFSRGNLRKSRENTEDHRKRSEKGGDS